MKSIYAGAARLRQFAAPRLRHAMRGAVDLLFPPHCLACGAECLADQLPLLCAECVSELPLSTAACRKCGSDLPEGQTFAADCPWCRTRDFKLSAVVRLGAYDGLLRDLVLRMKSSREHALNRAAAAVFWRERGEALRALSADVVIPAPMHWRRRLSRGANHAETLSAFLAAQLGKPHRPQLLVRRRSTDHQAELTPPARVENVRNALRCPGHRDLGGARVLLVDDVLTTGATALECARVLRTAGAKEVALAVLARADASF